MNIFNLTIIINFHLTIIVNNYYLLNMIRNHFLTYFLFIKFEQSMHYDFKKKKELLAKCLSMRIHYLNIVYHYFRKNSDI